LTRAAACAHMSPAARLDYGASVGALNHSLDFAGQTCLCKARQRCRTQSDVEVT
jgi:hypothetical protein